MNMPPVSRSGEETERREAIANAFLAFAAMMEKDYGVSKGAAVLSIQAAYDVNQDRAPLVSGVPMRSLEAEEEAIRRAPVYGPVAAASENRTQEEGLRPCGCTLDAKGAQVDICGFHLGERIDRAEHAAASSERPSMAAPLVAEGADTAKQDGGIKAASPRGEVSNIAAMVDRFLSWPLPKDFAPDCGISFSPPKTPYPIGYWPIGTNLFTADQARQMLEHVLQGAAPSASLSTKAEADVLSERRRQVEEEGWDAEHDDAHWNGNLALAAACYASLAAAQAQNGASAEAYTTMPPPFRWPWEQRWWKPKNPRRDLVRAAALILAEIERVDRAEGRDA